METQPHRTAIARRKPSRTARFLVEGCPNTGRLLDYGCGKGRDVEFYRKRGYDACGYDPHFAPQKPTGRFDHVACSYVLNVLPTLAERLDVARRVLSYLIPGGEDSAAVFTLRRASSVERARRRSTREWTRYGDGYITSQDTFQACMRPEVLTVLLTYAGFADVKVWEKGHTLWATARRP